jgi:hypothetical protein
MRSSDGHRRWLQALKVTALKVPLRAVKTATPIYQLRIALQRTFFLPYGPQRCCLGCTGLRGHGPKASCPFFELYRTDVAMGRRPLGLSMLTPDLDLAGSGPMRP